VLRPLLVFSLVRLAILLAMGAVLYLLGARGLVLVALAALFSGLLSLRLLARQREAVSAALASRREGTAPRGRLDAGAASEDG